MDCTDKTNNEIMELFYQITGDAFEEVVFDKFQCLPSEEEISEAVSIVHILNLKAPEYHVLYKGKLEMKVKVIFNNKDNKVRILKEKVND
jgi:hypothetical protein